MKADRDRSAATLGVVNCRAWPPFVVRVLLARAGSRLRSVSCLYPGYALLAQQVVDRFDCTPVLVAGTPGYAFTGDGTFGGLLATSTWPPTFWWPHGICHLVGQYLRFSSEGIAPRT